MIRFNDAISIIVPDKQGGGLKRLVYQCELEHSPSEQVLRKAFNFCSDANSAYASCLPFIPYNRELTNESDRRLALAHEETMARIRWEHPDLLAFSHRQGGWKAFEWNFNDDIVFRVCTNFGYGMSSYFFLQTVYKGYQLTPYSYYVKYRYAGVADICRYTYSYPVQYSAWRDAMIDAIDFYNAVVLHKDTHVLDWIKKHLNAMLSGLEGYLHNNEGISMNTHVEYKENSIRVSGDDWWVVKAEKIAGSMDFIENMRALPTEIPVETYIDRLIDINQRFVPQLQNKIKLVAAEIERGQTEVDRQKQLDHYLLYRHFYDKYWSKLKWYTEKGRRISTFRLFRLYRRFVPDYKLPVLKEQIKNLQVRVKQVDELNSQLYNLEKLHEFLCKSDKKIADTLQKVQSAESPE